ncbi:MAG: hypothetical protein ACK6C4_10985, partial [Bacteroidota bacterium]
MAEFVRFGGKKPPVGAPLVFLQDDNRLRDRIHDLTGAVVGSRSTLSGGRQALRERDHVAIITIS